MLACEDRELDREENWLGIRALGVLKGDIDDLGELFRVGLGNPTFAKTAALSRQVNGFFAIYLPWLLSREFPNIYTVFAGGDDFFLIGPWRKVQKLAARMQCEFARYVAKTPKSIFRPGSSRKNRVRQSALSPIWRRRRLMPQRNGPTSSSPKKTLSPALAKPLLGAGGQSWKRPVYAQWADR